MFITEIWRHKVGRLALVRRLDANLLWLGKRYQPQTPIEPDDEVCGRTVELCYAVEHATIGIAKERCDGNIEAALRLVLNADEEGEEDRDVLYEGERWALEQVAAAFTREVVFAENGDIDEINDEPPEWAHEARPFEVVRAAALLGVDLAPPR